ncbi:hypothetical protein KJ751_01830 [Patescibacteria group bacterium]|nr:hypothetical protein [Patescibacteria group bacterium]
MKISPSVTIPVCIEQGCVYLYRLDTTNKDGTKYSGDRFFVVLNVNPKTDTILILTTITKQIQNQKKFIKNIGESPDTLVQITPSDFSPLSQDSIINCNNTHEESLSDLITKVKNGGKVFSEKIPNNIINALTSGVLKSKQVPRDHKKLII